MTKPSSRRKKATSATSRDSTPLDDQDLEDISHQVDPASATIMVTAVEIGELTEAEESDRLHLERQVEKAFYLAGKALMELRDRKLYRNTHKTFEEYCRERFGFERRYPYRLMESTVVVDNLMKMCPNRTQNDLGADTFPTDSSEGQILPINEYQLRPLIPLEPEVQREAWQQAVEAAGGKVPSGRVVKDVVQRIMERTKVPNTYQIGEVCQILVKDNLELRGKGGCWAIVTAVNEFSCTVRIWDGEYTVGLQYLKSYSYLPAESEQIQSLSDRLARIYLDSLEETVKSLLQSLGKLNRPYLTGVEEKLLTLLESEYRKEIT
ncbi:MAG: hypothetical protein HWQ35_05905 [Nostoc sp. NMS1]|uniref:hypothetical protein n=1 Tax=unclassified Nostoc TaxID=2593658 RepID=UPI0025D56BE3|nr:MULTISPECIES: hypothetical protein [unclassified Nostoc]MBN3906096.1 hypothetical protein [Nostoc sp. NMS1]MBN3988971.1 hypothetical protein [Nostoc sp. NMS2]